MTERKDRPESAEAGAKKPSADTPATKKPASKKPATPKGRGRKASVGKAVAKRQGTEVAKREETDVRPVPASRNAFAAGAARFVDGAAAHLSTLFPPVRPRGRYLEVRHPDAQADATALACTLARIAFDDECRRALLRRLAPLAGRLDELWAAAAAGELADDGRVEVAA